MNLDILDRFTQHLRRTLARSIDLAWERRQERITPLYLLCALSEQHGSIAAELLRSHGVDPEMAFEALADSAPVTADATPVDSATSAKSASTTNTQEVDRVVFLWPEFTPDTKRVIERATMLAMEQQHPYVGTEHTLLALIDLQDTGVSDLFTAWGVSRDDLQQQLLLALQGNNKLAAVQTLMGTPTHATTRDQQTAEGESETPALDFFGVDLTAPEQLERIDHVIGRDAEIDRVIHILSRRTKNNPVLIGDAGVGKTAIVEGLAKRIADGEVPELLLGSRIVSLDLSTMLAGTMYRGEFEARLRQLVDELKQHPEVILFIDELHTIVGAGGVQGGNLDAANLLKPSLARGELRCIGATTREEYRQYIEADAALDRRFQSIQVNEPSPTETVSILKGLRDRYERYHYVELPDDVVRAAVQLSVRYMTDRRLPDKAIDLIDEAGAKARVDREVPPALRKIDTLRVELEQVKREKVRAVREERFQDAVHLKERERSVAQKLERARGSVQQEEIPHTTLTIDNIADTVASTTGIPREHIVATGVDRFHHLSSVVRSAIVGQDEAIERVLSVLKRASVGLQSPDRPLGSFLFLGPSGVGKTATARAIAEALSGQPDSVIRLDMSEYAESYAVSKMVGSPAGYVGYSDTVKLSDQIRRTPHSVVLFDEIEKAHPDIYNLLLQILDEGRLTDAGGTELDFRQSVIVMTSNIGLDLLQQQAALGFSEERETTAHIPFDQIHETIHQELRDAFPVEFLNRIDHTIVFEPLKESQVKQIVTREFKSVQQRLKEKQVGVKMMPSVRTMLARKSFHPEQGARLVRKTVADLIEDPLADTLLQQRVAAGETLVIDLDSKERIKITKQ